VLLNKQDTKRANIIFLFLMVFIIIKFNG